MISTYSTRFFHAFPSATLSSIIRTVTISVGGIVLAIAMRILPSDYPVLFEERAIADTIALQRGKIDYMVWEPTDDALLSMPTEDIVEHAYRNSVIPPVVISKAG